MNAVRTLVIISCSMLGLSGCHVWQQAELPSPALALMEPANDQVALDVSFVTVTATSEQLEEAVWREADEQVLDTDLRRRLAANGLRCGILSQSAPEALHALMLETKDAHEADFANGTGSLENMGERGQQMQLRTGRLGKIVATPGLEDQMVILTKQDERLVGETLSKAQCIFGVRCYPESGEQVAIELSPEVEHGEARTKFVGKHEHASWLVDSSRERHTFPGLAMRPTVAVGQTLLISCTPDAFGVGKNFFADSDERSRKSRTLLLIRVIGAGAPTPFSPATKRSAVVPTEG